MQKFKNYFLFNYYFYVLYFNACKKLKIMQHTSILLKGCFFLRLKLCFVIYIKKKHFT